MNENLKNKLQETLKEEAEKLIHSKDDIKSRLGTMDDITNMMRIIDDYEELEPILKEHYRMKHYKEKWGEGR